MSEKKYSLDGKKFYTHNEFIKMLAEMGCERCDESFNDLPCPCNYCSNNQNPPNIN